MENLEKLVFVNKNGKMRLWTAEDEVNNYQYSSNPADGIDTYRNIFYRHWDGSWWRPAKFPFPLEDVDLCDEWCKASEYSQYPIHIKDEDSVCYYAEIITDRDNLTCTLRIRRLDTHKGHFIKMSAPIPGWGVDYEGEYDLPYYNQTWYEIKFDILKCSVEKHRYRMKDTIEFPVTKSTCFVDDCLDDDIDWMLHDNHQFHDDTQSEIENVLLEKIKELQDLAKKNPDAYISNCSKEDHKGYELAKLMTQYPEFFKD